MDYNFKLSAGTDQTDYTLKAVVNHIGLFRDTGHYVTNAIAENGMFYEFDDGNVKQITCNETALWVGVKSNDRPQ